MTEQSAAHPEPLSRLWRILALPEVLMGAMGLLALALLLAALIPQIPPQAVGDPQAWLVVRHGTSGLGNRLIRALDLFDIYHAGWFRLLLALSGLVLVVRLAEMTEIAWRATASHRWEATHFALWGPHAPHRTFTVPLPPDKTLPRLRNTLQQMGLRWAQVTGTAAPNAVAGRRPLSLWAYPVAYGATLVALVGLAAAGGRGWQDADWRPAPGDIHTIGHHSPLAVRLESFTGQAPCPSAAEITWMDKGLAVKQSRVSWGRPVTYQNITVRLVDAVPAIRVRGWDAEGRPLTLESGRPEAEPANEITLVFTSPQERRFVLIPDNGLYLSLVSTPQATTGRAALILSRLDDEGNVVLLGMLDRSGEIAVGDLRLQIEIGSRPVLRFSHSPAMGPVLIALLLAVVALAAAWLREPGLLWLALEEKEDTTTIHLLACPRLRGDLWWSALGEQLEEALGNGD